MKKKKILFFSPIPPPSYGSAMSSKEILDFLGKDKNFLVKNVKINFAKEMGDVGKINFGKFWETLKIRKSIKGLLDEFNPDLVYFMAGTSGVGLFRDFIFVKNIRKNSEKKILFHVRARITDKDWKNPIYKRIYGKMFSGQRAIVLDESLKKDLGNLIGDGDIFVRPNAVANIVSENALKKIVLGRRGKDKVEILFLSNMDKLKGWERLLEACRILNDKKVDFVCNFVGAWTDKRSEKKFDDFVKKNGLGKRVNYLGKKVGKDKAGIFERADVFVFPTEKETFGRVLLEAMMYGIPTVANGIGAIPTTVQHGKTGFVLKENSGEEIAGYLEDLIGDAGKRERMGKKGRERFLKYYTLDVYEKEFKKLLKGVFDGEG